MGCGPPGAHALRPRGPRRGGLGERRHGFAAFPGGTLHDTDSALRSRSARCAAGTGSDGNSSRILLDLLKKVRDMFPESPSGPGRAFRKIGHPFKGQGKIGVRFHLRLPLRLAAAIALCRLTAPSCRASTRLTGQARRLPMSCPSLRQRLPKMVSQPCSL